MTGGTSNPPVEQIKHLFSDRPTFRPNRSHPILNGEHRKDLK